MECFECSKYSKYLRYLAKLGLPRLNCFDSLMIHGGHLQAGGRGEKGRELIVRYMQYFREEY